MDCTSRGWRLAYFPYVRKYPQHPTKRIQKALTFARIVLNRNNSLSLHYVFCSKRVHWWSSWNTQHVNMFKAASPKHRNCWIGESLCQNHALWRFTWRNCILNAKNCSCKSNESKHTAHTCALQPLDNIWHQQERQRTTSVHRKSHLITFDMQICITITQNTTHYRRRTM